MGGEHVTAAYADDWYDPEYQAPVTRLDEFRSRLLDSAGLDSLSEPQPLIDGILMHNSLAWLHGKPASGKSFLALDWASCVSTGLPWYGFETTPGPVLYVVAEGTAGIRQRVRAWEDLACEKSKVTFLPMAVQMLNHTDASALVQIVSDGDYSMVVLDTQARMTTGADENSSSDMGRFVAAATKVRDASEACVLMVHHEPRGAENLRGSSALEGAADTQWRVSKDGPMIELTNPKQKDAEEYSGKIVLWMQKRLDSAVLSMSGGAGTASGSWQCSDSETAILAELGSPYGSAGLSKTTILAACDMSERTWFRSIKRLINRGLVTNAGTSHRPIYKITER